MTRAHGDFLRPLSRSGRPLPCIDTQRLKDIGRRAMLTSRRLALSGRRFAICSSSESSGSVYRKNQQRHRTAGSKDRPFRQALSLSKEVLADNAGTYQFLRTAWDEQLKALEIISESVASDVCIASRGRNSQPIKLIADRPVALACFLFQAFAVQDSYLAAGVVY